MKNRYYLAIDIGASSGRHIVGWLDDGELNLKEVYRFKNGAKKVKGRLVWGVDRLFKEVVNGLKAAKEQGFIPEYIGIDTWAVDYALLDGEDNIIGDVVSYRDMRNVRAAESVHRRISFDKLYQRTGIQYQPFNTVYQLFADRSGGKLTKAKSFLMLPDYLNFLLTGKKRQEYTNATSTGMVNALTHKWDEWIIDTLGYDASLFGELTQSGTFVGKLKKEIEEEVGYSATVVLPATHDTASAVLAAPIEENSPYISSGTWSLLGIEQPFARTDENSRKVNYSNEGSINYGFRYQKNIMGLWIIQSIRRELGDDCAFSDLAQMARVKEKGKTIDVNDERFLAPLRMISEIRKAVGDNIGIASVVRVVYDSLALSYKNAIEELERNTGRTYSTLNIIGGGSRDVFLNELTAHATGKKVITGPVEATAIGNIIMQMIGAGELPDLKTAREIIKKSFDIKEVNI